MSRACAGRASLPRRVCHPAPLPGAPSKRVTAAGPHREGDLRMTAFVWPPTTTSETRYVGDLPSEVCKYGASSDVIELVREYAAGHKKTSLRILDVGCSRGVAAAYLKKRLLEANLRVSMSGVDTAPEVFAAARRNLDEFYEGNIEHVKLEAKYDVVLCARMMRFALPPEQKRLMAACAEHCMPDGVVIADAPLANMENVYHTVSKDRAGDYGASLIIAWDALPRRKRISRKIKLHFKRLYYVGKHKLSLGAKSLERLLAACLRRLLGRSATC